MLKHAFVAVALAGLAACSPPAAETSAEGPLGPDEAAAQTPGGAPAGADEAIRAWVQQDTGGDTIGDPEIFYGDFSGDGAPDALAYVLTPLGANNFNVNWLLFRNDGGQMTFVRREEEVYGTEPRDVAFANGQITLTTTMPRPEDPRCCPTGSQNWTIRTN